MSSVNFAKYIGVKVGERCVFGKIVWGTEPYLIEIGNDVQITDNVTFYTHGGAWVVRILYKESRFDFFGKIRVGNNVYLGNNVTILPGVTIGDNVLVAANSVITKSVESNIVLAGNPAKKVKDIKDFYESMKQYNVNTSGMNYHEKEMLLLRLEANKFIRK